MECTVYAQNMTDMQLSQPQLTKPKKTKLNYKRKTINNNHGKSEK